jgi:hypothetical protein
MMELKVPWLPGGIRAITLWPVILYRADVYGNRCIQLHEHYHWRQALRWGVVPWYVAYLVLAVLWIGRPIDRHPLEREAYKLQRECEAQR